MTYPVVHPDRCAHSETPNDVRGNTNLAGRSFSRLVQVKSASKVKFQAIWSCYYAKLVHYFPAENMAQLEQISLIRNPFQTDIGLSLKLLPAANEARLIDLSCDENLRGKFSDSSLCI